MPQVSLILPTRNEAECITATLTSITSQLGADGLDYEVLVMDDESRDGTQALVESFSRENPAIRLVRRKPPYGFGYSIRDGVALSRGKLIVVMMADLSDDPAFVKDMWARFNDGYDVVVGSRFINGAKISNYPFLKYLSNRLFNLFIMAFFLTGVRDTSNNFKAFSGSKIRKMSFESTGFEIGAEMMLRMLMGGARVVEIPVSCSGRTKGTAKFRLSNTALKYFLLFLRMLKRRFLVEK